MGQKSNTLTLRNYKENLNLLTSNSKEFQNSLEFLNVFKRSLEKKGVILTFWTLNIRQNSIFLTLNTYYKTQKLLKYKRSWSNKKIIKNIINIFHKFLPNKLLVLKQNLVNKQIDKKLLRNLYLNLKIFKNTMFSRRFNLFIDFLKLTNLFMKKEININTYIYIIGTIFRVLPKKAHGRFFTFVKYLFTLLIENKETQICGIKFIINGKLRGKLRASSSKILVGRIKTQTINSNIDFAKAHVYTIYGCFGLKIWVNYI